MNNNGFKNGALFGTIVGTSLGMMFGTRMSPIQRKKIARTAKRATSTLKNGVSSLWR
jgi:gas vesicle protein